MRRTLIVICIVALLLASFAPASAQSEQPIPVIPVLPADQAAMVQQSSAQSVGSFIYVVQRGDTLASIARRFGTTVQAIAQVNNIYNPNLIFAGQQLIIPVGTQPPTPPTVPVFYLVRPGDTLASIARQFGTTWQAIAQANNIQNPNRIYAGMYLIIPTGTPQPPPTQPTIIQYVVRPGDTLSSIARQFNTTVSSILQFNNIPNPNRIFWGTVLNIPVW